MAHVPIMFPERVVFRCTTLEWEALKEMARLSGERPSVLLRGLLRRAIADTLGPDFKPSSAILEAVKGPIYKKPRPMPPTTHGESKRNR